MRSARRKPHAGDTALVAQVARAAQLAIVGACISLLAVACGEGSGGANCLPEDVQRCTCADGH
jgi:hypothetical protein